MGDTVLQYCAQIAPNLFGVFGPASAPPLLFFFYTPICLMCLTVGLYIFSRNRKDHRNQWFLVMNILFTAWLLNILIQWTAAPALLVELSARFTGILELAFFLTAFSFLLTIIPNLPGKHWWLAGAWVTLIPVIFFSHSHVTIANFDIEHCKATLGNIWFWYIYPLELLVSITGLILGLWASRFTVNKDEQKAQRTLTWSFAILLLIFSISEIIVHITDWNVNIIGPIGIVITMITIAHSIIKYQFGNLRIMTAQLFVITLLFLTAAGFFVSELETLKIVQAVTFFIALVVGYTLIINVQKEVRALEALDLLNHQLQTQNGQLLTINQQKTEFISFATHQLRSPLTAMRGYASMLLEGDFGNLSPEAQHAVKQIHDASRTMTTIVDDYLNVSRIELKTLKFTFEKTKLSELVKQVSEELTPILQQSGLKLAIETPKGPEPEVMADREKLQQVITNLVDNAIKYTEKGEVKVRVYEHALGSIVCEVIDSGIGFTDTTKDKLFQKFSRADGNVAGIQGTGLGLYVAREIIKAHRGRVWATSEGIGKGSTFAFELPVVY